MKRIWTPLALGWALTCGLAAQQAKPAAPAEDPYLWLEGVTDAKALDWVKARNADALKELSAAPAFEALKGDILKVLDSTARIPFVSKQGAYYYNLWKDGKNPKGLWRRTSLEEYRKAEPKWDVILDLDALAAAEHESWVWKGATFLKAGGHRYALIALSRGGADATVTREFDLETRTFVKDGFTLPEAKGGASWIDKDTLYVATDFGPGSMTTSGYPRVVKRWKRGTPLTSAEIVYEGRDTDMSIGASFDDTEGFERHFVRRTLAFYNEETFFRKADGTLQKIDVPNDANSDVHREWLLVQPRTAWTVGAKTYAAGSLVAAKFDDYLAGKRELTLVFEPTAHRTLASFTATKHHLILNLLEDVKSSLAVATPGPDGWTTNPLQGAPQFATASASAVDARESDDYFMTVSGYLTPASLHLGTVGKGTPEQLKAMPAFFDASGLEVSQHFATSKDGTKVPYFQVAPKGLKLDGTNPTLLYGYGGFEISLTPSYSPVAGLAWTTKGGVYVVANIRGGGEYGPKWHQAALKDKRHRAYEDFSAVAEDLVRRKVTSVKHLGAQGGSNGGLLMGNMITLYPKHFGAIVCQVPLLDMKRYNHLLAGASWMAEYGNPDVPEQWNYIRTFSPYQNLKKGVKYPPTLFTTSTRDDRVHPGHARKMMARMQELGANVRSYENIEGGHGGAANNQQAAQMQALAYTFLWQQLKK
ncbi:MAG: S9 family peptidase [Acidobacteria bacterium]|nr:S9 family peptidase [Acidobacteriota bacterium]